MEKISLIPPQKNHEAAVLEYMQEHFSLGEDSLHGSSLLTEMESYSDWLTHLIKQSSKTTVTPDWVVATTLLAVREKEQKIIGTIDIRHELNEFLREFGGHIGFGVRPTETGNGYATEMLRLGLEYCKMLGLEKVMVACYEENVPSARTIQKNGGVLEKTFVHEDGQIVQIYWIDLTDKR